MALAKVVERNNVAVSYVAGIPGYPDTAFLKTMVNQREVGVRPLVELESTDHPLAVEQRDRIEEDSLRELVIGLLHPSG